jgi:DMSO reductase family type II enzyme molybdopterin subunit
MGLRRRTFLLAGAAGTAAVGLGLWNLRPSPEIQELILDPLGLPVFHDWRDVYQKKWSWDKVVLGTHTAANCVSACAWHLYVRDGVVWREEQSNPYEASNESVPDWNPRGCQKGACYSDLAMGPSRVQYPMKRVGERGAGKFKRISWDEALEEIAENLVDTLQERGGSGAVCEYGGHMDFGPTFAGTLRFFRQIGVPVTDCTAMVGDLAVGATITFGDSMAGGSSDDWFRSDYLVLWGFNPSATRIPDAHFIHEARYRGAQVVVIAPDMNQSTPHADLWMPIRPGADAALAMAACQVVVEEGLLNHGYVTEQTDLPFLVHKNNGRFLRESDMVEGGSEESFAIWNQAAQDIFWMPGTYGSEEKTLRLPEGVTPDLTGSATLKMADGTMSGVITVFSKLQERLKDHTPEIAASQTGIPANVIRRFARDFAKAPAALILSSYGMCKNYHSDLIQRAQILLASLTGNHGRAGGGWRSGSYTGADGMALVAMQDKLSIPDLVWLGVESYRNPAEVEQRFRGIFISSTLFHAVHGGLAEEQTKAEYGDPLLPEGAGPYLDEALKKGHFGIGPGVGENPPDVIINTCGNILRHARMGDRLRDGMFKRARLVVDVTFRMSETSRYADILLPAAGWYEKMGLKYIPTLAPYVHLSDRAVAPLGESKPEWEIFGLLAEKVSSVAERKGVQTTKGFRGEDCDLTSTFQRYTDEGRFGPTDDEKVLQFMLGVTEGTRGITIDDLRREGGAIRLKSLGKDNGVGVHSPYSETEPIVPMRDYTVDKKNYPTLTGRQQFYIDHPWFLKVDEGLPRHKAPPAAGGDHPFTLTGGHTRWSIHAVWRDHALLLRLQRGEPVVFLNQEVAAQRGIADHDRVRVWNDLDEFEARAKITGAIRPDQVHIFHAWEPYQFRGGKTHQGLSPSPIKITQLVGDYGHIYWSYGRYEPNGNDRDTRVDIARQMDGAG